MRDQLDRATASPIRAGRGTGSRVAWVSLGAAVLIGIQLGTLPWRYRKEMWQLQGGLAGALVGFWVGRVTRTQGRDEGNWRD